MDDLLDFPSYDGSILTYQCLALAIFLRFVKLVMVGGRALELVAEFVEI